MGEEVEREDGGCTRKRGRAESKGHGPAQSPLGSAFDCQPTRWLLTGFTFGSLPRARARSFVFPSALSSLIVSAPSVIPGQHHRLFVGLTAMAHCPVSLQGTPGNSSTSALVHRHVSDLLFFFVFMNYMHYYIQAQSLFHCFVHFAFAASGPSIRESLPLSLRLPSGSSGGSFTSVLDVGTCGPVTDACQFASLPPQPKPRPRPQRPWPNSLTFSPQTPPRLRHLGTLEEISPSSSPS